MLLEYLCKLQALLMVFYNMSRKFKVFAEILCSLLWLTVLVVAMYGVVKNQYATNVIDNSNCTIGDPDGCIFYGIIYRRNVNSWKMMVTTQKVSTVLTYSGGAYMLSLTWLLICVLSMVTYICCIKCYYWNRIDALEVTIMRSRADNF